MGLSNNKNRGDQVKDDDSIERELNVKSWGLNLKTLLIIWLLKNLGEYNYQ
jgi:hypothetical protein